MVRAARGVWNIGVIWILFFPLHLFAIADVSVSATIDPTTLNQGWPIQGTLEITHYANQKVDEGSVVLGKKPLKINLLKNVTISPDSNLLVTIYQFTLPAQNKGSYTLPPISLKIDGRTYQTMSVPYEVQGPVALPQEASISPQAPSLKLEAYIDGPKDLYPGQITKLVYRYIYNGNISLSQEILPMLEATGLQKVGRNIIKNYSEGDSSVFEISQEVQAVEPGEYSWGPSTIEGVVYLEDALGNKQFTTTKLKSEVPPVKLIVKPFPVEGKPASFNGAFGQFTFDVTLTSPVKVSVGDPLTLDIAISGKTSNWDRVNLPELCCQPGFGGFFKLGDLPPIGKMQAGSKHFTVEMNPLSSSIKSIPAIQFSYFDPLEGQYKILYSQPVNVSAAPMQDIAQAEESTAFLEKKDESHVTAYEWHQIYKQLPSLDKEKMLPLETSDVKNKPLGSWWTLWFIPFSIVLWTLLYKLRDLLNKKALEESKQPYKKFKDGKHGK